jgi:Ca-activated chloride channel family protein
VPYILPSALEIRDTIERGGELDAFVMEYQTFIKTDFLSGDDWVFIPYGVPHDNPLYAVGDASPEEIEVLELFAEYAKGAEWQALATDYGFDPPPYPDPMPVPSDPSIPVDAQRLWKENKDPVTAIFVCDVSGSMQGPRIRNVRQGLIEAMAFISEENLVGIVIFDDQVTEVLKIGEFDPKQQRLFAGAAEVSLRVRGGTAMYDAIAVGLHRLLQQQDEYPDSDLKLIVLTDGETMDGLSFDDVSGIIEALGIPVITIGFEADIAELTRVSGLVEGGRSFNATEENVATIMSTIFRGEL